MSHLTRLRDQIGDHLTGFVVTRPAHSLTGADADLVAAHLVEEGGPVRQLVAEQRAAARQADSLLSDLAGLALDHEAHEAALDTAQLHAIEGWAHYFAVMAGEWSHYETFEERDEWYADAEAPKWLREGIETRLAALLDQ